MYVSGVAVYDSTPYSGQSGWLVFGGTSVSAPIVAAASALTGTPASLTAGSTGSVTVTAKDALGNTATDYTGTGYEVTVTKSDGSTVEVHLDSSFNAFQGPGPGGYGA